MNVLGSYKNGNYTVTIYEDGTKIRENDLDTLIPDTVESFDFLITKWCDIGCPFCHEDAKTDGKHGDILNLKFLETLHPYTEIAIGGGYTLAHPDFDKFLQYCKEKKFIPSMTVNQIHFERDFDRIKKMVDDKLIYGLGISLTDPSDEFIEKVKQIPNAVIHVINGIVTLEQLQKLSGNGLKILILGYKEFRRGVIYLNHETEKIKKNKRDLYYHIPFIISHGWFKVISFDNLAISQLDIRGIMSPEDWKTFYMGDDGEYTMYIDAVNQTFAKNSCEPLCRRYPLMDTVEEMFAYLHDIDKS